MCGSSQVRGYAIVHSFCVTVSEMKIRLSHAALVSLQVPDL